jgi:PDZ domain-containing secreted protein
MTLYVIGCQRLVPLVRDTRALRDQLGDVVAPPRRVLARPSRPWTGEHRPDHRLPGRAVPRRRRRRWAVLALVVVAAALATVWHPPLAVVAPGRPFDVADDITITGVPTTPVHGRYLVPTVRASHPTLLGLGLALLHPNRRIVSAKDVFPPGTSADTLRRNGEEAFRRSQLLGAAAGAQAAGLPVRVVGPEQAPSVQFPFTVQFRARPVGGPSAGLAYALAVEDMLDGADLAHGRTIAATGDVLLDGRVGPVGYVGQKTPAAMSAGATLLLVPDIEVTEAWGNGLQVDGVGSVRDAIARLR